MEETTDIGLSVTLLCKGYYLEEIRLIGSRCHFLFSSTSDLGQVAHDYWNGKILVEPKRYQSELKNLKTRMFAVQNNG